MTTEISFRYRLVIFAVVSALSLGFFSKHYFSDSGARSVEDVQVAFWSWRSQAPDEAEVRAAFASEDAKTLFLRAGQVEASGGSLHRIRPVQGRLPSSANLHLVYNGTRGFLQEFERIDVDSIARTVAETYFADVRRAADDGARVEGLQLDFDVPTRLLPKYTEVLRHLRGLVPSDTELSITGLPTWISSADIEAVLEAVDFWIPQYYGAAIPIRVDQRIPISSPSGIARAVRSTAALKKPFYAGLSAYGYAILYSADGDLVEMRGDIDPASAMRHEGLEFIERRAFEKEGAEQYVYRAKRDLVIDGLIVRVGENLVFDVPTAESLRVSARAVRENGGHSLIGICVFRLPTADDETNLSLAEVRAALDDLPAKVSTAITMTGGSGQLKLRAENTGTARAIVAEDAFTVDLDIPAGSLQAVDHLKGFADYETLCRSAGNRPAAPCSERRANVLRIKAGSWGPSVAAEAAVTLKGQPPPAYTAVVMTRVNDGRIERESFEIKLRDQ